MTAIPPDYDTDPERWRSHDRSWLVEGDAHEDVAARIMREKPTPILDIGCAQGRLRELLGATSSEWVGLDSSPTQVAGAPHPAVQGAGQALPFQSGVFGAAAAIYVLHHLDEPASVIVEARRVLRRGGVFFAVTGSRFNDPELLDEHPPTPFDAEEAPSIVSSVFGNVEVVSWDGPFVHLTDEDAIDHYCRSHRIDRAQAKAVRAPLTLTKRGSLVIARQR